MCRWRRCSAFSAIVQVIAHRTKDKNGYVALQLGATACARCSAPTAPIAGHFAVAKVGHPKRKLAEFRVDDAAAHSGRRRDHRRSISATGQYVDVTGTSTGKGFCRAA